MSVGIATRSTLHEIARSNVCRSAGLEILQPALQAIYTMLALYKESRWWRRTYPLFETLNIAGAQARCVSLLVRVLADQAGLFAEAAFWPSSVTGGLAPSADVTPDERSSVRQHLQKRPGLTYAAFLSDGGVGAVSSFMLVLTVN